MIPYYERFLAAIPDVAALAAASEDEVLRLWSGLGYYARARNLHAAAGEMCRQADSREPPKIAALPGIGRSTAAAIAAFAFGERAAILDGNVKRVLARDASAVPGDKMTAVDAGRAPAAGERHRDIHAGPDGPRRHGLHSAGRGARPARWGRDCVARKKGRIDELPAPRPRRRCREGVALLVLCRTEECCSSSGQPGIWGGLWSFPERRRRMPWHARAAAIEHGFTHFACDPAVSLQRMPRHA